MRNSALSPISILANEVIPPDNWDMKTERSRTTIHPIVKIILIVKHECDRDSRRLGLDSRS
jgi:hypothetical protein